MNIKVLLGLAFWAHSFSCADALRVVEKSPLDTIARELKDKPGKESSSSHGGADKEESSTSSTSKGGKNPPPPNESNPLFVTSASCPQECLSANYLPDSQLLTDSIEQCDAESYHQQWEFLKVGTFNMLKNVGASASDESTDWCLGVVPQEVEPGAIADRFNILNANDLTHSQGTSQMFFDTVGDGDVRTVVNINTLSVKNDEELNKLLGGVTTTYLFFSGVSNNEYRYTDLNVPGHKDNIKNMITGSATADVGLLLVPAEKGGFEAAIAKADLNTGAGEGQLLQDARFLYNLGVEQIIVGIQMVSYGYACSEDRFNEIKDEFVKMLQSIGFKPKKVPFIPYSGFNGDNLVENSDQAFMWYKGWEANTGSNTIITGSTVVEALNNFIQPPKRQPELPVRLPISNIYNIKGAEHTLWSTQSGPEAMCNGGKLGLVSCGDSASQWYATGGQLISSHCYALGFSSILSVDEDCNDLFVSMTTPDNDNGITRSQTFLAVDKKFIETIPPPAPTDAPTYFPTS